MCKLKKKEKIKVIKPECYKPNNDTYPLCLGAKRPQDFAENDCKYCDLYEDQERLF